MHQHLVDTLRQHQNIKEIIAALQSVLGSPRAISVVEMKEENYFFLLSKYEVTQAQWARTVRSAPSLIDASSSFPRYVYS